MKKLRVTHVGKFFPPHFGGIELHVQDLVEQLSSEFDLNVLVSADEAKTTNEIYKGVPITRLATLGVLSSQPITPGFVSALRNLDTDILHFQAPNPLAFAAYLMAKPKARLVITYQSDILRQKILRHAMDPMMDHCLSRASAIIATSPNYIEASPLLRKHRERCVAIPLGIPLKRFEKDSTAEVRAIRERFKRPLLLSVGRLVPYKGFEYLLKAMPNIEADLILIGDGPLRESLKDLATTLGIAERVHFLGKVDSVENYYKAADIYVLPSIERTEAFALVQVEAMACGVPVINTSLDSGVPFVSLDRVTGLTVPPKDSEALARAINELISNEGLRRQLGAAAKERAYKEFSVELMGKRVGDLYRRIV